MGSDSRGPGPLPGLAGSRASLCAVAGPRRHASPPRRYHADTEEPGGAFPSVAGEGPPGWQSCARTPAGRLGAKTLNSPGFHSASLQPEPLRGVAVTRAATQMGCKMRVPSVFIMLISSFIKMLMNIVFIYHLVTCAASFPGDECAISLTTGADRTPPAAY